MKEMRSSSSRHSTSNASASTSTSTLSSRSAARVHPLPRGSACLSCRARRVRCDEGQPCSACVRNAKFLKTECNCVYGSTVKRSKSNTNTPSPKTTKTAEEQEQEQEQEQERIVGSELAKATAVVGGGSAPILDSPPNDPDKLQRHMAELERTIRANLKALKTVSAGGGASALPSSLPSSSSHLDVDVDFSSISPAPSLSHSHPSSPETSPQMSYYSYSEGEEEEEEDEMDAHPSESSMLLNLPHMGGAPDSSLAFPPPLFNYFPPTPTAALSMSSPSMWMGSNNNSNFLGMSGNGLGDPPSIWDHALLSSLLPPWKPEDAVVPELYQPQTQPQPSTCYPPDLFSPADFAVDYFSHHETTTSSSSMSWSEQQVLLERQQLQLDAAAAAQGWGLY